MLAKETCAEVDDGRDRASKLPMIAVAAFAIIEGDVDDDDDRIVPVCCLRRGRDAL